MDSSLHEPKRTGFGFQRRTSGVLLPLTSLPGRHGSGDLSAEAFRFIDLLSAAGQSWWQMLPVDRPAAPPGHSPYSSSSSIAGSPYLVSLDRLCQEGWLTRREIEPDPRFQAHCIQYSRVRPYREQRLRLAWERFQRARASRHHEFMEFCEQHRDWLDDFALYCTLKQLMGGIQWPEWPRDLRRRHPATLADARRIHPMEFGFHRWVQFQFHRQWAALRRHARQRRVGLIGDIPICVSHHSADVWANPALFKLDRAGQPTEVSGYPPDDFCPQGQRWGHPQYHWPEHQRTGFSWWIARFAGVYRLFDAARLDHFLGFTRLWSIPARTRGAKHGRWIKTPGRALFSAVRQAMGNRLMIAEDLGHVTPADVRLRNDLGIPAMRILQWGLGPGNSDHRPHRFSPETVAYTGTHDNNTIVGWFRALDRRSQRHVLDYTGGNRQTIHVDLIRLALTSAANTAMIPIQDLLGLDAHARINRPGTLTNNWRWRILPGQLSSTAIQRLRHLTEISERLPENRKKTRRT